MLKVHFSKKVIFGFAIALGLLTWLAIYSYRNTRQLISSSQWVAHTHDVLYHAEQVLAVASNIEIGQRGYALTGNKRFLEPYNSAKNSIHDHYETLQNLTRDNEMQQKHLQNLGAAIDELLLFSSSAIDAREQSFDKALAINATLQGKETMDKVRQIISSFENEEKILLRKRIQDNEAHISSLNFSFISLLVAAGIILVIVFYLMNINLSQTIRAQQKVKKASEEINDLYDNAPCGYHSLDEHGRFVNINKTLLQWLGYSDRNELIGKLSFQDVITSSDLPLFEMNFPLLRQNGSVSDLEFNLKRKDGTDFPVILSAAAIFDENGKFVKSRSTTFDNSSRKQADIRIKELNKELEAFTYSVSHDLRAPLRSIDGYAKVLEEDFAPKLDDEGKRVVKVIMNNAKRMGQLIDDLLDFARLGRKDVARAYTDMTPLVKAVAGELVQQENGRKINIDVKSLHPALVDTEMIRQVWTNLISNAIKYTGKNPESLIEISSFNQGEEVCYQVKDNGVGFDMQYVNKLFGVFQRLHKIQEFAGTGVGLAIVKRIVNRHHGKVWAEGVINQGAIFYFSIPSNGKQ
jgi:PAS domain S-box-containing protein